MKTAVATIKGFEVMRMIRRGHCLSCKPHVKDEVRFDGRTVSRPYPLLDRDQARRYLAARDGNQIVLRFNDRPLRLKTAPYFWYLPFWLYTPTSDPRLPEPAFRAWRRRAAEKDARQVKAASRKEARR